MTEEELNELYFEWLISQTFLFPEDKKRYLTELRTLHDIPFYWTMWNDENRAGDALAARQFEFIPSVEGMEQLDLAWLHEWGQAAPSVLEVLIGMANRYSAFFDEEPCQVYFQDMFKNLMGEHLVITGDMIRAIVDQWLSRTYYRDGRGSPFPLNNPRALGITDARELSIWALMNAYSAEHYQ